MKKFTILLATIATLFSASLFTACSDNDSKNPTIVGTWVYSETEDGEVMNSTLIFEKGGSGSLSTTYEYDGVSESSSISFDYVYNESTNALTILGNNTEEVFGDRTEAFITANKLRLVMYYDYYEESLSITFTRK